MAKEISFGYPRVSALDFGITADPAYQEGRISWNSTDHTLDVHTEIEDTIIQLGQETVIRVLNNTGVTIPNGTVCRYSGVQGQRPTVVPSIATDPYSRLTLGVTTNDILNNQEGYLTVFGGVRGVNTSMYNDGDILYVSDTVAGGYTTTQPEAPYASVVVAVVINSHVTQGILGIRVRVIPDLMNLADVDSRDNLINNDVLRWVSANSRFERLNLDWVVANQDPTGFDRGDDGLGEVSIGDISFVDGTRTFTIEPQGGESNFSFWSKGTKYEKTAPENVVISDVEGLHFIYYDTSGVLQSGTSLPSDWLTGSSPIAIVRWDSTNSRSIYFGEERHGYRMPGQVHRHFHYGMGALYYSGINVQDLITDGNGSLDTHIQFSSTSGTIADEDIVLSVSANAFPANIPIYYKLGPNGYWRLKDPDNYPLIYDGTAGYTGTRIPYNEWTGTTWQLSQISSNNCIVMLYFATNDASRPIVGIQGQNEYSNIFSARVGILSELDNLVKEGLPFVEFVACWGMVVQSANYSNTPNARFRTLDDGSDYLDLRVSRGGLSTGVSQTDPLGPIDLSTLQNLSYVATKRTLADTVDDGSSVFGSPLYLESDGNYERCDASLINTMPCRAMALEAGNGVKLLLTEGYVRNDFWNWIVKDGSTDGSIYVSETVGELTQTAPSTSNAIVQKVGYAVSPDIMYFQPSLYTEEVS